MLSLRNFLRLVPPATCVVLAAACSSNSGVLGKGWTQATVGPKDFYGPVVTVDVLQGEVRYNNLSFSEAEILGFMRKIKPLDPQPTVYLRFSDSLSSQARRLAQDIRRTGICDEGACLYQITAQ
jgi:hypothetical protein